MDCVDNHGSGGDPNDPLSDVLQNALTATDDMVPEEHSGIPQRYLLFGYFQCGAVFLLALVTTNGFVHTHPSRWLLMAGAILASAVGVGAGIWLLRRSVMWLAIPAALGATALEIACGFTCAACYDPRSWILLVSLVAGFCGWTVAPALTYTRFRKIETTRRWRRNVLERHG